MMDADQQREQNFADTQYQEQIEAELDRLWAAYGDLIPYRDAKSSNEGKEQ